MSTKERELFPAHAGVILNAPGDGAEKTAFPRACGGDPIYVAFSGGKDSFSPRMRG